MKTSLSAIDWKYIRRWLMSHSFQAPLLLSGITEEALNEAAEEIAAQAVCQKKGQMACNACRPCRHVKSGQHPDVVRISGSNKTISIKEVQRALKANAQSPISGRRVVLIPAAERLSLPAANALLKALEESLPHTRFVLTSIFPMRLLPTILSRCQRLRIKEKKVLIAQDRLPAYDTLLAKGDLTEVDLKLIAEGLSHTLRHQGPSQSLLRSYMRLRDYYKILSHRGNAKLAAHVLLASLDQLQHNDT